MVVANNIDDSLTQVKGIMGRLEEEPASSNHERRRRQHQHRPRRILLQEEDGTTTNKEESVTLVSSMFHVTLRPTAWTMGLPAIQVVEKTTEAFLSSMLGVNNDLSVNEQDAALVHLDSISAHVHDIEFHRRTNHADEDGPNTSERNRRRRRLLVDRLDQEEDVRLLLAEEGTEDFDSFTTLAMSIEATFRGDLSHAPPQTVEYLDALLVYAFTSRPMATVQFRDWLSLSGNSFFHQVTAVQVTLPSISSHPNDDEPPNPTESDTNRPTDEGNKTRRMSNLDISFMVVSAAIFVAIVAIVVTHVQKKRKSHSEQVSYFETNPASRTGRHGDVTSSLPPPSLTFGSEGHLSLRQFAMESSISSIHSSNSNPSPSPTTCLRNASHLGLRLHGLRDDAELHCHLGPMMQPYENENENENENEDASV
eukprot:scaffold31036_cov42-Attheya_sp.AAC.4